MISKRTKIFIALASVLLALSAVAFAWSYDAEDAGDNAIVCRCARTILGNPQCSVMNDGEICAESEPGKNIQCFDYKSNCQRKRNIFDMIRDIFKKERDK